MQIMTIAGLKGIMDVLQMILSIKEGKKDLFFVWKRPSFEDVQIPETQMPKQY